MFSKILNHQQRQQLLLVTSIVDILHGYFNKSAIRARACQIEIENAKTYTPFW